MSKEHEEAYGQGKSDAEEGKPDSSQRGALETAALASSGIGLLLDEVLPGGDPKVQQSYEAGREEHAEEES
jgi:hypothetical protein